MSVKNIVFEIEGLIKNTVMSCASMYGFSAEEALAKIDSNGNLNKAVIDKEQKKAEKQRLMEQKKAEKKAALKAEKAEKEAALKAEKEEAEKQQKEKKEAEKAEKKAQKEAEKQQKEAEKQQKAELAAMKEEEILSKAAEKLALKQKKEAEKKPKKVKKVASPKASLEDEEPFIRFQNIPLIDEINSIRDVKKFKNWKKLSAGVKLARQIMDI
jgi:hypothetical protein